MLRVDANSIPAQMIDMQPFRYRTFIRLISESMGEHDRLSVPCLPITIEANAELPLPTVPGGLDPIFDISS